MKVPGNGLVPPDGAARVRGASRWARAGVAVGVGEWLRLPWNALVNEVAAECSFITDTSHLNRIRGLPDLLVGDESR